MDQALSGPIHLLPVPPRAEPASMRAVRVTLAAVAILATSTWVIGFAASRTLRETRSESPATSGVARPTTFESGARRCCRSSSGGCSSRSWSARGWCVYLIVRKPLAPAFAPDPRAGRRCEPVSLAAGLLRPAWSLGWLRVAVLVRTVDGDRAPEQHAPRPAQRLRCDEPRELDALPGDYRRLRSQASSSEHWRSAGCRRSRPGARIGLPCAGSGTGVLVVAAAMVVTASLPRRLVWELLRTCHVRKPHCGRSSGEGRRLAPVRRRPHPPGAARGNASAGRPGADAPVVRSVGALVGSPDTIREGDMRQSPVVAVIALVLFGSPGKVRGRSRGFHLGAQRAADDRRRHHLPFPQGKLRTLRVVRWRRWSSEDSLARCTARWFWSVGGSRLRSRLERTVATRTTFPAPTA